MSWVDKIQTTLKVTTGDGKSYTPLWRNAQKAVEFNVAEFNFPQVPGTLVDRREVKGRSFPIEFYFTGENHLDTAAEFETSSLDKRPWVVEHPYYGRINVQPISLNFDNSDLNLTRITGELLETITDQYPKGTEQPADKISADADAADAAAAATYANNVTPTQTDIADMQANLQSNYNTAATKADSSIAESYLNAFNSAQSAITQATTQPLAAITAMQAVLNKPALFAGSVQDRFNVLGENLNNLRATVAGITTRSGKYLYQNNGATLLTALARTAATPLATDYANRVDVLSTITQLLNYHSNYLTDLQTLQTANGGAPDSFLPDINSILGLNQLINYTLGNLFAIALNAKQQRSIILEEDSNWILLAHRFYGLLPDDSTITRLIAENGGGLYEMLHVRKGRVVLYYL